MGCYLMAAFMRASQGEFSRRYREYVPDLAAVDCWVRRAASNLVTTIGTRKSILV